MTHEEHQTAQAAARFGYGPLAHVESSARLPAFGGEFQPGLYRPVSERKFGNPAPLGLCAFALTTFVLSLINMNTRNVAEPNIVVALAFGYGGLVQLLAGMWYVGILRNILGGRGLNHGVGNWRWATLSALPLCLPMAASGSPLPLFLPPVGSRSLPASKRPEGPRPFLTRLVFSSW